ncbi:MAG: Gfo/Idh/MocA family oxidoreductase [Mycobacterium sp.]|uniref:Gfo/Idh/MocA family protein n=1 Tax=Mycobacterium sp. TaxID=1785 RepID=UPI003C553595
MSITPLRLALIGLGGMGMTHLEIFAGLPHAQIAAVADSHALFADRAAAQIPTAAVFYDPLDCVNNADIDAVVVATTDDTHFDITQASIARGLHVLCEKPLTTTAHQSRQVVDAERATGRRLVQVGWMRRFDADYQNLYSALRSGTVGEPVLISQRHRNPLSVIRFDERELITSSASHDIDIFRWLCGEDIAEISAVTKTSQDGAAVIVVLTLASQSGVLGVMELGRGPGLSYDIGCDIVGSAGALTLTPADPARADDHAAQPHTEAWMQRFAQAYRTQDAAWLTAVASDSAVGASARDGYATNAVIDAALASLASGRAEPIIQDR